MTVVRIVVTIVLSAGIAPADDVLHPGTPQFDRPTLTALGIKLPITGDDNYNAKAHVRYRRTGAEAWLDALPLHRVHPDNVRGWDVEPQFSGSIFDLRPATQYDIEVHVVDPDGPVDQVFQLSAATRAVPPDPAAPREVPVNDTAGLKAALSRAQPGDMISLADGVYAGPFSMSASGTGENPIVIRGASQEDTILDGGGCSSCNVIEVYGRGFVHIERLTVRSANRGIRFQTSGAEANVVRRVSIRDVRLGIGAKDNQKDFYLCDNTLEGRLKWPSVYTDDNGAHANDDGIMVQGFGHVVCHNRISGFGDAMKIEQDGARAVDFYGNEVTSSYDNGVELDSSEANARCLRNRFTNVYATLSVQPVYGGPAYLIRNIVLNSVHEQMKFHALGTSPPEDPSGIYAYHNTFVSPYMALNLETSAVSHNFAVLNNLFVGPAALREARAVNWNGKIDDGLFDYNGYFPDGMFTFNLPLAMGGRTNFPNFAAVQRAGVEKNGLLLSPPFFADGLAAPATHTDALDPRDGMLDPQSNAIDRGTLLPNINDLFTGAAPDLGALEYGCPPPIYGPRPEGVDESNEPFGCVPPAEPPQPAAMRTRLRQGKAGSFQVVQAERNSQR